MCQYVAERVLIAMIFGGCGMMAFLFMEKVGIW